MNYEKEVLVDKYVLKQFIGINYETVLAMLKHRGYYAYALPKGAINAGGAVCYDYLRYLVRYNKRTKLTTSIHLT